MVTLWYWIRSGIEHYSNKRRTSVEQVSKKIRTAFEA